MRRLNHSNSSSGVLNIVSYFLLAIYLGFRIASKIHFKDENLNAFFDHPIVGYAILVFAAFRIILIVRKVILKFKLQDADHDFYDRIYLSIAAAFPNLSFKFHKSVSQEIAMIYYAFFAFETKKTNRNYFSYYKNNSAVGLYFVFIFLTLIETGIVHFMLIRYGFYKVSIALFIFNIYSIIFLTAHLRAMKKRPIEIGISGFKLNNGLFMSQFIKYSSISEVTAFDESLMKDKSVLKIGLFGKIEPHNVLIKLKEDTDVVIFYGVKKTVKAIMLYVNDANEFTSELNEKAGRSNI